VRANPCDSSLPISVHYTICWIRVFQGAVSMPAGAQAMVPLTGGGGCGDGHSERGNAALACGWGSLVDDFRDWVMMAA